MYKVLRADRDAYITDRVIKQVRAHTANLGGAGSLDLFKLYGVTLSGSTPNIELSRLLIHFDLTPLRELVAAGRIDLNNASFACTLKLFDVYGGQPTPSDFTVVVNPLSRSFDEGLGRDVVYYADRDTCNFLTGSRAQGPWLLSGCGLGGGLPGSVDYATASAGVNLTSTQRFVTGEEDLEVDITAAISATLAGAVPDEGFRIAFNNTAEADAYTYFVKRFASRTAFNEEKHPRLIVRYDDSVQDDSQALTFDAASSIFLFNYARRRPANLTSGSALTPVTGANCVVLKLSTEISGGVYNLVFTGSQHRSGINFVTGVYSASVNIPSTDATLASKLARSGSVKFTPIWGSLDGTVSYVTGTSITAYPPQRGGSTLPQRFTVSVSGLQADHTTSEEVTLRINIFDPMAPVKVVKVPTVLPGIVVRDVHYQVRDAVSGLVHIPFDTIKNSTRASSDALGMYVNLDTSNLTKDKTYIIDVMLVTGTSKQVYRNASPVFRVSDLT